VTIIFSTRTVLHGVSQLTYIGFCLASKHKCSTNLVTCCAVDDVILNPR